MCNKQREGQRKTKVKKQEQEPLSDFNTRDCTRRIAIGTLIQLAILPLPPSLLHEFILILEKRYAL